jgi:hypothetical protein
MGPLAILLLVRLLVVASGFSAKESTFASFGTFRSVDPTMMAPPVGRSSQKTKRSQEHDLTDRRLALPITNHL